MYLITYNAILLGQNKILHNLTNKRRMIKASSFQTLQALWPWARRSALWATHSEITNGAYN